MARGFVPDADAADAERAFVQSALTTEELVAAAHHKKVAVRAAIAGRADLPLALLILLAQDAKADVRGALAANPVVARAASVVALLEADKDADVVAALAHNEALDAQVAARLLHHPHPDVRRAAVVRLGGASDSGRAGSGARLHGAGRADAAQAPAEDTAPPATRTAAVRGFRPSSE